MADNPLYLALGAGYTFDEVSAYAAQNGVALPAQPSVAQIMGGGVPPLTASTSMDAIIAAQGGNQGGNTIPAEFGGEAGGTQTGVYGEGGQPGNTDNALVGTTQGQPGGPPNGWDNGGNLTGPLTDSTKLGGSGGGTTFYENDPNYVFEQQQAAKQAAMNNPVLPPGVLPPKV